MSLFKNKKSLAQEAFERAMTYPEDSLLRTNALLEAQFLMQFQLSNQSAWSNFESGMRTMAGR